MNWIEMIFTILCIVLAITIIMFLILKDTRARLKLSTIIFYFNTKNKTFRVSKSNKSKATLYFLQRKGGGGFLNNDQSLSRLTEFFNDQKLMAKIRNAFFQLESSKKNYAFSSLWKSSNSVYKLSFEFAMTGKFGGIGSLTWTNKKETHIENLIGSDFRSLIKKIKPTHHIKLYALKTKSFTSKETLSLIVDEINLNISCNSYFAERKDVLYFCLYSKKVKSIVKSHRSLVSALEGASSFNLLGSVFSLAFLSQANKGLTVSKMNEYKRQLDFTLYKIHDSINNKKLSNRFIYSFTEVYSEIAFEEFKEVNSMFSDLIKKEMISGTVYKIYNAVTKKASGNFVFPSVSNVISKKKEKMIYINWVQAEVIDTLAAPIVRGKLTKFPRGSIIQLNDYWLLENYKTIQNKDYLYCISLQNINMLSKLSSILNFLQTKRGIKYGIEISSKLQIDNLLLQDLTLSFVVISNDIAGRANLRNEFSKILLINNIFNKDQVKIIYVNPSVKLDNVQRKKLDIKYIVVPK